MKMSEVNLVEDVVKHIKNQPLIEVNYNSLIRDFNFLYADMMDLDHPEEMPEAQLAEVKTNLFVAFCYGAVTATDTASTFRKNFNLPKEVLKKVAEPKIWTPDTDVKKSSGIIV